MSHAYRDLFHGPGTVAFTLAGLLARLPLPMMGIGIITLLAQWRGSYALAGAVSATFVLTYALLSPQISRLVDRHGQRRVLPAATLVSLMGTGLLLGATWAAWPDAMLFVGAAAMGAMPSASAMVRARWTALYRDPPDLTPVDAREPGPSQSRQQALATAYALETVFDEMSFIIGPPLAVGLSVAWLPQAGLLLAAGLLALGMGALVQQRRTEPPVQPAERDAPAATRVLRQPTVQRLTLLMVALGVIVGTVDIGSVAFAEAQGYPAAASLVLSAYACGSCLAGLAFGARPPRTPLPRLLAWGSLATALSTVPLALASHLPGLAATVFVAGLCFAPTMIVAMALVERAVPAHQVTEGMTWLLAGLNVGVALGAMLAGQLVDARTAAAGFLVALGAGVVLLVLPLAWRKVSATPTRDVSA